MPERSTVRALSAAIEIAERARFSGDKRVLNRLHEGRSSTIESAKQYNFQNALNISPDVTPGLFASVNRVLKRLSIHSDFAEAFIYSSADLQAECLSNGHDGCLIRFSSALADLLDEEEYEFVVGHELGHFLLNHGAIGIDDYRESIEHFINRRAQEISADRVGLIACGSLEGAIRALMKTLSGLSSRHLRFDVPSFISQLRKHDGKGSSGIVRATHPSILVRCRALLWYSLKADVASGKPNMDPDSARQLDKRIAEDLDKYVDRESRQRIEEAKQTFSMWVSARAIARQGRFKRGDQKKIQAEFGAETLQSLKNFLSSNSAADIEEEVLKKLREAEAELFELIPSTAASESEAIKSSVEKKFGAGL